MSKNACAAIKTVTETPAAIKTITQRALQKQEILSLPARFGPGVIDTILEQVPGAGVGLFPVVPGIGFHVRPVAPAELIVHGKAVAELVDGHKLFIRVA